MAISLLGLAELYSAQGKDFKVGPLCRRALMIQQKALGQEHPTVVTSLERIAILLLKTKHKGKAKKLLVRVEAIRTKCAKQT